MSVRQFIRGQIILLVLAGAAVAQSQPSSGSSAAQSGSNAAPPPQSSGQPQPPGGASAEPAARKPVMETATMRLASAKSILVVRMHGSPIPVEVIRSTVEGWGRFTLAQTPEKADLIIEVYSSGDSGVQVSSSSRVGESGKEEKSNSTRKDISPTEIRMTVIDARNKRPLWSASESVKFAMKEKSKENNMVEAAEKLASKFHARLESGAKN